MLLFVQLPSGERLSLEVEPNETLLRIKQLIALKAPSLPIDRQRLLFAGRQLESDNLTLVDAGVAKETTIMVTLKRPQVPPKPPSWSPMRLSPDEMSRRQYLLITILDATSLKVGDLNGYSDPYCMIKVGAHNFRTRTIDKTLNPTWNYNLRVETCGTETLLVQVWDEDTFSSDDFLGQVAIPLNVPLRETHAYAVRLSSFRVVELLLPREGKNDKKIRGSVRIALQWEADIARRRRMEDALQEWNATWLAEAQAQGLHP